MDHYGPKNHPVEKPLRVVWDKHGVYNQWGTKYIFRCSCGNDAPCNMYGMGTCLRCGIYRNPLEKKKNEH